MIATIVLFQVRLGEAPSTSSATPPPHTYSDMNGYGHFVAGAPLVHSPTGLRSPASVRGVVSIALARRGADARLAGPPSSSRASVCPATHCPPAVLFLLIAASAAAPGTYYNAHVLNDYLNAQARSKEHPGAVRARQQEVHASAASARRSSRSTPHIDIFPERRSYLRLRPLSSSRTSTPTPISQVHISDAHPGAFGAINVEPSLSNIGFNRPFHTSRSVPISSTPSINSIRQLAPGDTVEMSFNTGSTRRGASEDGHEIPDFAYSGTFFDNSYSTHHRLRHRSGASRTHAGAAKSTSASSSLLPHRGDPWGSLISIDYVKFRTTVSTSDVDSEGRPQTAISPGYLQKDWHQDGRHYFTYDMGQVPMADFINYNSARYDVTRDVYQAINGPVAIEVYHIPEHNFDVQDMIDASKASLAYYEKNYGPYQFRQYRILEYPRYRSFAESFPNTVPFSEAIGFIGRVEKPDDIDESYFITAHEFAHQWWGHQLIGGNVEGSNMMSESLAEYSALRVMEKKYGPERMRKFLSHELDGYLRGRAGEISHENPLALVQNETYVWYQKGSLVLYALSDYIGEDKLNQTLHTFLQQHQYPNAYTSQVVPYPDTRQFVAALRAATPPELQYYITDAFENIVLYDNKALSATYIQTPDKKYKVTLTVQARKVRADGNGLETPMPIDDYIDIGVFSGKKGQEKQLYLQREKISREKQTFDIVVDELPTRAGIDPYNKLIDRDADDNVMKVTKQ